MFDFISLLVPYHQPPLLHHLRHPLLHPHFLLRSPQLPGRLVHQLQFEHWLPRRLLEQHDEQLYSCLP